MWQEVIGLSFVADLTLVGWDNDCRKKGHFKPRSDKQWGSHLESGRKWDWGKRRICKLHDKKEMHRLENWKKEQMSPFKVRLL
jgi:hypothetical protein